MDTKKKYQIVVRKNATNTQIFLMFRKVKLSRNLNGGEYIPFNFWALKMMIYNWMKDF